MEQNKSTASNRLPLIINAVLIVAVAILFYLQFNSEEKIEPVKKTVVKASPQEMKSKIAFVNSDRILTEYALVEKLARQLEAEQLKKDKDFTRRQKELEEEAAYFQESVQKQSLSEQSAQKIYNQLMAKQEDLYKLQDQYSGELAQQEYRINQIILDSVKNYLDRYNSAASFDYILNYNLAGSILLADDNFDITEQVLTGLNEEYFEKYPPKNED